ncbi:S-layer homology domain-containing protein [Actinomarinicola tropica]|uniref:SLH domain-containing protein n=1 Tax=Actinomarinicola tropica TaxID=2789776 RepID=A0A5Q2RMB2_9ACTN|nr:S-layer homology domain-containing protein [Actinomarinicola tropica]QGG96614.1 hypothetical protein GH723_16745 [Actinomarinicola tropica]
MTRWGRTAAGALIALALTTTSAAGAQPAPATDGELGTFDGVDPALLDAATSAAPGPTGQEVATLAPQAVVWRSPTYSDPTGDATVDLRSYRMEFEGERGGFFDVFSTIANPDDLTEVLVAFNTNRRWDDGCNGYEYLLLMVVENGVRVDDGLGRARSCDDITNVSGALGGTIYDGNGGAELFVARASLGNPYSVDWTISVIGPGEDDVDQGGIHESVGWVQPFADVPLGAFYTGPVAWLRSAGLTTGVGSTGTYQPDGPVTRGQMATYIHRIEGSLPAPPSPFVDVPRGAYYTAAVDYLYDQGLTTGVGGTNQFQPDGLMTRGQMITFLWRVWGSKTGYPHPGFSDVTDPNAYYYRAVAWAKATGVTTGVGATNQFQPDATMTRGQLATFLQRSFDPLP